MEVKTHLEADGTMTVTINSAAADIDAIIDSLPALLAVPDGDNDAALAADIQPMGLLPRPRKYCVKVYHDGNYLCQKTIYESPLWAWARCVGITRRRGGNRGQMSSGACQGPSDCGF